MNLRTGLGIDFHRFGTGLELWLGGVLIPFPKGCIAHSDGDCLMHAICDAMLGAAALGDIGHHFPDNSPEFKNIAGRILLTRTNELIREKGYCVVNIDSTICLEEPLISPYTDQMKSVISAILSLDAGSISIKATTTEKMGFTGRGEGIAALASVLLKLIP